MLIAIIAPLFFSSVLLPVIPATYSTAETKQVYIEKTQHTDTTNEVLCSCVAYTKQFRPDIPLQDAGSFVPATTTPYVGAVAVMRYPSGADHVAYVADVRGEEVLMYHANVVPCRESIEWMDVDNSRIIGYL